MTLKVLPDENARVAAIRSGQIDGCTVTPDTANTLKNDPNIIDSEGLFSSPRHLAIHHQGRRQAVEQEGRAPGDESCHQPPRND